MNTRNFCLTDFGLNDWERIVHDSSYVRGGAQSLEVCPETGRQHHQVFIQTMRETTGSALYKKLKMKDQKYIPCNGTVQQNIDYVSGMCPKKGNKLNSTFKQFGIIKTMGGKLSELHDMMVEGCTEMELMNANPRLHLRYGKGLMNQKFLYDAERAHKWRDVYVEYKWGPPRTNKTRDYYEKYPDAWFVKAYQLQNGWWDGYAGEDIVILDEYDSTVKLELMEDMFEGYRMRLKVKGAHIYAAWTKIYVTSNYPPEHWHQDHEEVTRPLG